MEDKKKKAPDCCSCEADFKEELRELENQAQAPTKTEHDKKREELNVAFKDSKKK